MIIKYFESPIIDSYLLTAKKRLNTEIEKNTRIEIVRGLLARDLVCLEPKPKKVIYPKESAVIMPK